MSIRILIGDCRDKLRELPDASVHCCVTSPPYFGLRDYGVDGQMGLEPTPDEFVAGMVEVFREVRRTLRDDGTLWLNIGDTIYSGNGQPKGHDAKSPSRNFSRTFYRWQDRPGMGLPKKSLVGVPWKLAFALQADGWTLRSEIIWHRPAAFNQGGVSDRPFTNHETLFLLSKSRRYWFNEESCAHGTVWTIPHEQGLRGHSAAFPPALVERCLIAGCPDAGIALDPFGGAGTTGLVADRLGRNAVLIELNPEYAEIARNRLTSDGGMFAEVLAA